MARKPLKDLTKIEFIKLMLRRFSSRWPAFDVAKGKARVKRGVYRCRLCAGLFGRGEIQKDHIKPVVPVTGWDDWNGYLDRLFCPPEGIQILCKPCHKGKTAAEAAMRARYRKKDE